MATEDPWRLWAILLSCLLLQTGAHGEPSHLSRPLDKARTSVSRGGMKGHAGHSRCGPLVALCRCHARSMNYMRCRRKQLSWTPLRLILKSHVDSPLNHVFTFLYIKTLRKTLQLYPRLYSPHPSLGKVTLPSAPSAPLQSPQRHTHHKLCSRPTGVPLHKARVSHGAGGSFIN